MIIQVSSQPRAGSDTIRLWNFVYFSNVGLYGTLGSYIALLYLLQTIVGVGYLAANFITFFFIVVFRASYETTVIWKVPIVHLPLGQFAYLAALSSLILVPILYILQILLGGWSAFVVIALSSRIIGRIKNYMWGKTPAVPLDPFLEKATEKLAICIKGLYIFFGCLAVMTYAGLTFFGPSSFLMVFSFSLLVSLVPRLNREWVLVYDQTLSRRTILRYVIVGITGTLATVVLITLLLRLGCSGSCATIVAVIALELAHPLLTRRLLMKTIT